MSLAEASPRSDLKAWHAPMALKLQSQMAGLRAKIAALEATLAVRDDELRLLRDDIPCHVQLRLVFPELTTSEADMLGFLVYRGRVSREAMSIWLYGHRTDCADPKIHDIRLCRLRKVLPSWLEIQTVTGWGWALTEPVRDRLQHMLQPGECVE